MIIFQTALYCEAKPLIDYFGLKKDTEFSSHQLFQSDRMALIISGIGKIKAAVAQTQVQNWTKNKHGEVERLAVNIGVAGIAGNAEIGTLCVANKITDFSSKRTYYPDILTRHGQFEDELVTSDEPVTTENVGSIVSALKCDPDALFDMEGAGFFEAANYFLPCHKIAALKIISDHLNQNYLDKDVVSSLIEAKLDTVTDYISRLQQLRSSPASPVKARDLELIGVLSERLRLTTSQQLKLKSACKGFKIRNQSSLGFLADLGREVNSKKEAKGAFEEIISRLSA